MAPLVQRPLLQDPLAPRGRCLKRAVVFRAHEPRQAHPLRVEPRVRVWGPVLVIPRPSLPFRGERRSRRAGKGGAVPLPHCSGGMAGVPRWRGGSPVGGGGARGELRGRRRRALGLRLGLCSGAQATECARGVRRVGREAEPMSERDSANISRGRARGRSALLLPRTRSRACGQTWARGSKEFAARQRATSRIWSLEAGSRDGVGSSERRCGGQHNGGAAQRARTELFVASGGACGLSGAAPCGIGPRPPSGGDRASEQQSCRGCVFFEGRGRL